MAKRIFSYPWSAEEEADSIRNLLLSHKIDFFETPASRWGFTHAAIWLKNDDELDKARAILQQHHLQYAEKARQQYQLETGYNPDAPFIKRAAFTIRYNFKRKSILFLVLFGFALLIIYFYSFFALFRGN
jgi:hypothetical protein